MLLAHEGRPKGELRDRVVPLAWLWELNSDDWGNWRSWGWIPYEFHRFNQRCPDILDISLTHIKVDTEFSASGFSIKTYLRYLVHLALLCCLSAFNFVQCWHFIWCSMILRDDWCANHPFALQWLAPHVFDRVCFPQHWCAIRASLPGGLRPHALSPECHQLRNAHKPS